MRPVLRSLFVLSLVVVAFSLLAPGFVLRTFAAPFGAGAEPVAAARPDESLAAALFSLPEGVPVLLTRQDAPVPGWRVSSGADSLGMIGSTWEIAGSTGYSGQPLDALVAVNPQGVIVGTRLMRQSEPVLTLGISESDIAAYVGGFVGVDVTIRHDSALGSDPQLPDVISRATVSTGVIRDGILRSARVLAQAQGIGGGAIDRVSYAPATWDALIQMGALNHARMSMAEAAAGFAGARQPLTPSDQPFIEVWAGLIDTPTVGRNLIGAADFTAATGPLQPDEALLAVISQGVYSHRGTEWRRSGSFDRIEVVQGATRLRPAADDFTSATIRAEAAPDLREASLFRINANPDTGGIDPRQPFEVIITAARPGADGSTLSLPVALRVSLPEQFQTAPEQDQPLWLSFWHQKKPAIAIVAVMLAALGVILFAQEWLVRSPKLWRRVRVGFLATTLFVLGWGLNGQLSVVQVVAFLNSLLAGFRWETFLIEPVIFMLWSAVALGLLFWGRGVFCGWLCPFGALQELTNNLAQRLGVRQIAVPQALHERLWVIKYTLFVAIVALSFYSMEQALVLAEAEPFKTAISMRFLRAWPFVLFVVAILTAGLFIERFYCRYMCPLGAGLAIPAKLKIFDWLKRRPQCGRECRLCETKCTVGAIDPLGRINPNECVLCLRCQVIMNDAATCPVLKRRARGAAQTEVSK
ncbi:MAG: 4Fe-4S binding protein [Paracoccus sp. (in: a-proteobacteria)]|uniref:NosR/NirI family protein n=1 Tax=Paracoccus sp. TaxID=267 RepID=UPI0026DF309E|nr:NosR/NirI family protein [Paracoccus sp. (in: a-proteobacteria)]MDO5620857.1 4Fe-4S binding protein [Paracoccus sp. (in: a-proteobacteria)]